MKKSVLFFLAAVITLAAVLYSCKKKPAATVQWTTYCSEFGCEQPLLPYGDFYTCLVDSKDNIWLSADWFSTIGGFAILSNGVVKEMDSTNSNYPGKLMTSILQDPRTGHFWCIIEGRLYDYDKTNWVLINTPSNNQAASILGIDKNYNLYFAFYIPGNPGTQSVYRFDGSNWTLLQNPFEPSFYSMIAFDKYGIGWLVNDNGLYKVRNDSIFARINDVIVNRGGILDSTFIGFPETALRDNDGNIWFGTNAGLFEFDGTNWINFYNKTNSAIPDNYVMSLALDKNGSLWVGTYSGIANLVDGIFINLSTPFNNGGFGHTDRAQWIGVTSTNEKYFYIYGNGLAKLIDQ